MTIRFALLGLAISLAGATGARAQQPDAAPERYWIFFRDKAAGAGKAPAAVEPGYLSDRARWRRALRGVSAPAHLDAPLSAEYLAALEARGVDAHVESRWLNAVSAPLRPEEAERLRALPFVADVRPVGTAPPVRPPEPDARPSDAPQPAAGKGGTATSLDYGPSAPQIAFMNADEPLAEGVDGRGVILGFLDTTFDFDHPAFARLKSEGRLIAVQDFTGLPQTDSHGLNTSSIAVGYAPGELIGPAHGASVLAATTEYAPTETNREEDNFVAGMEWMERMGADVVNVSLGYTTFDPGQRSYVYEDLDGDTGLTTRAADRAASLGVVVVASAGNEGSDGWRFIGTPADGDSVIAVGAARIDSTRASFSSFGPTADGRIKPDVSALGITTSDFRLGTVGPYVARPGGYQYTNGTSFSSPLVAGVVCQILQVNPALDPIQVRDLLRETASQAAAPDNSLGWGIVNAQAAVLRALGVSLPNGPGDGLSERVSVYPNPVRGVVTFELLVLVPDGPVAIRLYDLLGRAVATVHDAPARPGMNRILFDAAGLAPGMYLYRIESAGRRAAGTLVLTE